MALYRNSDGDLALCTLAMAGAAVLLVDSPFIIGGWALATYFYGPKIKCKGLSKKDVTQTLCNIVQACNGELRQLSQHHDDTKYCSTRIEAPHIFHRGSYAFPKSDYPREVNASAVCPTSTLKNAVKTGVDMCCSDPGDTYFTTPYERTSSAYADCMSGVVRDGMLTGGAIGIATMIVIACTYCYRKELSACVSSLFGGSSSRRASSSDTPESDHYKSLP